MSVRQLHSSNSKWEAVFGFSRAVEVDDTLYISKTGALNSNGEITATSVAEQTRIVLENISRVLEQANFKLDDVIQSRMYLTEIDQWQEAATVHGEYFNEIRPAFTLLHVLPFPERKMIVAMEVVARRQKTVDIPESA
ncbi:MULTISPECIES: RidA family protein [unclassified Pseudomonas]|uniref:RidA family protein n=1 Tax=unclassified Pseudomonas TaxID=196821 RepID=UPI000D3BFA6C|nr:MULTISPECIES: RidA family protein [unclassified Pseudomonas]PTR23740.1 enamine deaminase RidA (YjgF/YER057c/UK114 family) [Pseudomonas sp. GV085]